MGLFDSKAKRIEQHRQLIELARATLESLKVETVKAHDITSLVWTEMTKSMLPLEYRWWVSVHMETLACAVYNTEQSELGNRDWIRELAESVTTVRFVMAGLPDTMRNKFRAETFARLQRDLDEIITREARSLAAKDHIVFWDDILAAELKAAEEALTWFDKQDALDAASALRHTTDKNLPTPYIYKLKELARNGEATLASVRENLDQRKHAR